MSYYKLLGVATEATDDQIKVGYKSTVLKAHPDKGGSAQLFKRIQEAYETLRSPDRRERYDAKLSQLRVIRRFANSSYRPVEMKDTIREPAVFPLLDGSSYTFETAPSALRCRFRHGDVVRNGKGETGCFVGQASNGMYWKKEGEAFASLLFSSGFGGESGMSLVYRAKEPAAQTTTPRPMSRTGRETPTTPRSTTTPRQSASGGSESSSHTGHSTTPRPGAASSGCGSVPPSSARTPPPASAASAPSSGNVSAAAALRRANIEEARNKQLLTTIKRLIATEEAKRVEINICVDKFIAEFDRAVSHHRARPATSHPRSMVPSTNLKCFQNVEQLQRHGAMRGSSAAATMRPRSATPSTRNGASSLSAPTAASRQRSVSGEAPPYRRTSQTSSQADSTDGHSRLHTPRTGATPGRTQPAAAQKASSPNIPVIPTLATDRVQCAPQRSTTRLSTPRRPEVDISTRKTNTLPMEDEEPLSHQPPTQITPPVATPAARVNERHSDPVPMMAKPKEEPIVQTPAKGDVSPSSASSFASPPPPFASASLRPSYSVSSGTSAKLTMPFASDTTNRARSADPPKLTLNRGARRNLQVPMSEPLQSAPEEVEEVVAEPVQVAATHPSPAKPFKLSFGAGKKPSDSGSNIFAAKIPPPALKKSAEPYVTPVKPQPPVPYVSEERSSRELSEDPETWLSPPKYEDESEDVFRSRHLSSFAAGTNPEASAAFLKKLYLGSDGGGGSDQNRPTMQGFDDDEDEAVATSGRHGRHAPSPSGETKVRSKSVSFDTVPKVAPLTPRTVASATRASNAPRMSPDAPPAVRSTTPQIGARHNTTTHPTSLTHP